MHWHTQAFVPFHLVLTLVHFVDQTHFGFVQIGLEKRSKLKRCVQFRHIVQFTQGAIQIALGEVRTKHAVFVVCMHVNLILLTWFQLGQPLQTFELVGRVMQRHDPNVCHFVRARQGYQNVGVSGFAAVFMVELHDLQTDIRISSVLVQKHFSRTMCVSVKVWVHAGS